MQLGCPDTGYRPKLSTSFSEHIWWHLVVYNSITHTTIYYGHSHWYIYIYVYIIPSTTSLGPWEFIVDPDIWGLICYSFSCSEIFTDQSRPTRGGSVDKGLAWKYFCSCQKTMLIEIFNLDLSTLTSLSRARSKAWLLVSLGCSMLARYSFPQHPPVNLWDVVWFRV
jgi:hypothetical protein